MWKQSDFRNLLKWSLGFFKEDSDKPSQKRLQAFGLGIVLSYHSFKHPENTELLITLFGMIAVLLGMSYIPTRKSDVKV